MSEVAAERDKSYLDTEVRLTFVKSVNLMEGFLPTIRDDDFNNDFIREPVKY